MRIHFSPSARAARRGAGDGLSAGGLAGALRAVGLVVRGDMAKAFQVDTVPMKAAILSQVSKLARVLPEQQKPIARQALTLLDQAIAEDDFDTADVLSNVALAASRKSGDKALLKQARERADELATIAKAFESAQSAQKILESNPTDPAANLTVGKYTCFVKRDWATGVSMLALGSDAQLKAIATKDVAEPADAKNRTALADQWYDAAESQDAHSQTAIRQRAAYWYKLALPGLTGLTKDRVEKRIEAITGTESTEPEWYRLCDFQDAKKGDEFVCLQGNGCITTKNQFSAPLDITIVARTDNTNIRTSYGKAGVIWNWEVNREKLRVNRPDGSLATVKVPQLRPGTWYKLRWVIRPDGMLISVNNRVEFTEEHQNLPQGPLPVKVYCAQRRIHGGHKKHRRQRGKIAQLSIGCQGVSYAAHSMPVV